MARTTLEASISRFVAEVVTQKVYPFNGTEPGPDRHLCAA
jgi:hypothetical protein